MLRRRLVSIEVLLLWIALSYSSGHAGEGESGQRRAIREFTGIPYRRASQAILKVDVYLPTGPVPRAGWPAVLAIHSGGWVSGDRSGLAEEAKIMARHGYVVMCPDYRLGADSPFPAGLEDVGAALGWLASHARVYGINTNRVGVFGASAGGQLALLIAQSGASRALAQMAGRPPDAVRVRGVCSWFGPTDFLAAARDGSKVSKNTRSLVTQYLGGEATDRLECYKLASPISHATAGKLEYLFVHGVDDAIVPVDQSRAMVDKLKQIGAPVEFIEVAGAGHWFVRTSREMTPPISDVARQTIGFFDRALREERVH